MKELSVTEYAAKLNITRQAVLLQIKEGRLAKNVTSKKVGATWVIVEKSKS